MYVVCCYVLLVKILHLQHQLFVCSPLFFFLTQELNWSLSPQTPISWLNVYMQVAYLKETDELLIPRYPQATFTQIAEVVRVSLLMN